MVRAFNEVGQRKLIAKSCLGCGEFKAACEYRMMHGKYYQPNCKACQYVASKKSDKKANHASWSKAGNASLPWTGSDLRALQDYLNQRLSYREIAEKMNRSIGSINAAKNRYQIKRA